MPSSLRDIALRTGLSTGTISRVLNNLGEESRIREETQIRIRLVAKEMGYKPNKLARKLGMVGSRSIGIMIPGLHNPFFLNMMETAEDMALKSGYDVLPDSAFQLRVAHGTDAKISGWPVDGILLWATPDKTLSSFLPGIISPPPVVYLGYARDDEVDYVGIDREVGLRQLMQHLRDKGYSKIAYLYPWQDLQPVDARYDTYDRLCKEYGMKPRRLSLELLGPDSSMNLITQSGLREAGLMTGLKLANMNGDRPDSVICHNDLVAIGLYNGLRRAGLKVPEDIAVAGFDGIQEGQYLDKQLTTVVSPGREVIASAIGMLTMKIENRELRDKQLHEMYPSELRVGATT